MAGHAVLLKNGKSKLGAPALHGGAGGMYCQNQH
jgi:hypothetical protein